LAGMGDLKLCRFLCRGLVVTSLRLLNFLSYLLSLLPLWAFLLFIMLLSGPLALAGGPKWVAGVSYFNPGVKGQPVRWAGGQVKYFVDRGALNAGVSQAQAVAMVDAAAAIWSAVPTAAVALTDGGNLAEDVNGANVLAGVGVLVAPADVVPTASGVPVAVIFDADGSVIDALYGVGASQPDNCTQNGVFVWVDAMGPDATLQHGVIVLNGRCATTANLLAMMQFQVQRAFGRILGLDFSQVNDGALAVGSTQPNGALAWPMMLPLSGECGPAGGNCIPNPTVLRMDDVAALNRMYPVTSGNIGNFSGKVLTAQNTVSIQGTISFRTGQGMQGVNVVARPLDAVGNPLYQYTVTFVSGSYFGGNHGNAVTGWVDAQGNRLDRFGSDDATLAGYFDLSGVPLPPGMSSAAWQVSFEAVNPLYINSVSVGPYLQGSPAPSGTLAMRQVAAMQAGGAQALTVAVANSAGETPAPGNGAGTSLAVRTPGPLGVRDGVLKSRLPGEIGVEAVPRPIAASGAWTGRLGVVGQADWFVLPVRGNRIFTVVTQALDETGKPTMAKAMPALGVWDGYAQTGTAAAGWTSAQNGLATGETWLQVATQGSDVVRLAVTDQRGDGRPDYFYKGWVLYADTVTPARVPGAGGTIVIRGMGFRQGDTVLVGGARAQVVSILPNEITALAPAAGVGVTGSQDVEVDDLPTFFASAMIPGGVSYDAGAGDAMTLVTAPSGQVPMNVPQAFSVIAKGADGTAAGGVMVTYSVTSGTAVLGCGLTSCSVTTAGDGRASMTVTATSTAAAVVTAFLTDGASLQAHFNGGTPAAITSLTPTLYLAAGATVGWPVQALVQSGGVPVAGQAVKWQTVSGVAAPAAAVNSDATGTASATLTVGPLGEGQMATSNACLNGGTVCAAFNVMGSRPEFAGLTAVSGTAQSVGLGTAAAPVVMRVLDMNGNSMAGGTVTVNMELYAWAPACPPHGRCAQAPLLASSSVTVTSGLDGTVTVTPLGMAGVATKLVGLAATGNAGSLGFSVEVHP
jgi:hypothetical protein